MLSVFIFQDPLNRKAAPPIIEKTKKPMKQQAPSTADIAKQVVSNLWENSVKFKRINTTLRLMMVYIPF